MPIGGIPTEEDIEKAAKGTSRQWDDGEYTAVGLQWFDDEQHTDDGDPIYVVQQGDLVARCRLLVQGEEDDGPPMSIRPGQILALAKAFGVDVDKKWPDPIKDSSKFLQVVERAVGKTDAELKITVSGGWVSDVPGWSLPRDQSFQLVYVGCDTLDDDGDPCWRDYGYGRSVILRFKIIGDLDGDTTPYDGWEERIFVPYRVAPDPDDPDMPTFVIDDGDKGNNTAQVNCYNLMQATAPTLLENESWEDTSNVMPEWDDFAKEAVIILRGDTIWSKKAARVKMPIWMIKPRYKDGRSYKEEETPKPRAKKKPAKPSGEEVIEKSSAIDHLYKAITQEVRARAEDEKAKAFGVDGKLTKAGAVVAREVFGPLIEEKKLPGNIFAEWEDGHVQIALKALGDEATAQLFEDPEPHADF